MSSYPSLPLAEWQDTKTTLHCFTQVVGKIKLDLAPTENHWWHITYHVSGRGLTTRAIPYQDMVFELAFDLVEHRLNLQTSKGASASIPLQGISVAEFYSAVHKELLAAGIEPHIYPRPFDPARVGSDIPFPKDSRHSTYQPDYVARYWTIISRIAPIFQEFRGRFIGKCSPVHLFWHSFDLAVTRFSGRAVDLPPDADLVTRTAYSHEVSSAGFWVGDDNLPEPAFYCYAHKEPEGMAKQVLQPAEAFWNTDAGSAMAIYRYEDFKSAADPRLALLAFLQSSYEAAANLARWPRQELEAS